MRARAVLVLLLVVAGFAGAANLPVKRYALFVGANLGGAAQQPLRYAQKDALKFQQVMQDVGGVTVADRMLLLDPTPDDVKAALTTLAGRIAAAGTPENRRTEFLLYYSGHSDEEGLLLGDQSLSYKALRDGLQAVPADVRIAILDSCSSGAFAKLKGGVQRAPFLGQDSSQMKGHAFLTSSSETEASQESQTLEGSFFTHYLVSGLRGGADRLGDGLITLNEAYEYAFQNTLARTESTRAGPQHPSYEIQLSGTGNLILSDVKASTARLNLAAEVSGKLYVRNLSGQLFAEVTKDAGTPLQLAFPAGTYTVTAVSPQKSLSTRVVLTPQGPATLGARDFQEQELARFAVRGPVAPLESEEPPVDDFEINLETFSLGLIGGLGQRSSEAAGPPKVLSVNALVDYASSIRGVQASGLIALNGHRLDGVQAAGLGSLSSGPVQGGQASGLFNVAAEDMQGFQLGGLFNIAGGESNGFLQSAGLFNLSRGSFRGFQTAGLLNVADGLDGVQASVVNVAGNVRGVQSAVLNVAGDVQGIQIGLVNINSHFEGLGIGLVNISPDAYYHPTLLWDDEGKTHVLFQWGMGALYWLVGGVGDFRTSGRSVGEGLVGAGFKLDSQAFFWDTDVGTSFRGHEGETLLPYLRSTVGLQTGWISVEGGVLVTPDGQGDTISVGTLEVQAKSRWFFGLRFF